MESGVLRKPGDRKLQILQAVAEMLELPRRDKITTAALAEKLDVSEAALYRHFASKAQMFEGLIAFIEQTLFGFINRLGTDEPSGIKQAETTVKLLLGFAGKNPGMTRVLTGEALVHEDERLQARVNQLLERLETSLRQSLRIAQASAEIGSETDVAGHANALLCYVIGRWHQFAKSGFRRQPLEEWERQWQLLRPRTPGTQDPL
jgi:TetR/AcrR family transcriptional regulator